jgi:hypothetical protein
MGSVNNIILEMDNINKQSRAIKIGFGVLIGAAITLNSRNTFSLVPTIMTVLVLVALPAALGHAVCNFSNNRREKKAPTYLLKFFELVRTAALLQILILPVGMAIKGDQLEESKSFCRELTVLIEKEKSKTGQYPADIEVFLRGRNDFPANIRPQQLYFNTPEGYILEIVTPGIFFPMIYHFDSRSGKWEIYD